MLLVCECWEFRDEILTRPAYTVSFQVPNSVRLFCTMIHCSVEWSGIIGDILSSYQEEQKLRREHDEKSRRCRELTRENERLLREAKDLGLQVR